MFRCRCVCGCIHVGSFLKWFFFFLFSKKKLRREGGWPKEGGGEWVGGMSYHPYLPYFTRVSIYLF
jgi:hypothetical protein